VYKIYNILIAKINHNQQPTGPDLAFLND